MDLRISEQGGTVNGSESGTVLRPPVGSRGSLGGEPGGKIPLKLPSADKIRCIYFSVFRHISKQNELYFRRGKRGDIPPKVMESSLLTSLSIIESISCNLNPSIHYLGTELKKTSKENYMYILLDILRTLIKKNKHFQKILNTNHSIFRRFKMRGKT